MFLGSDAIALAPFTNSITYLEDGDWAVVRRNRLQIYDMKGEPVERKRQQSIGTSFLVDKGNHRHFMEKEIHEQPEVISHTLAHYLDFANGTSKPLDLPFDFAKIDRLAISACGTAYLAGLISKYWFERYARLPVDIDIASEFRYREMPISPKSAALFVSQSGETADTLASLRYCRKAGLPIGAIVNVRESTIARESDVTLPTLAGPEIGVASTKAFTCQLAVLASLAVRAAARAARSRATRKGAGAQLSETPRFASQVLKLERQIEKVARELAQYKHVLYLGRDTNYPLAMEGALKLKEISYIHAEGYAAGELKHGPIALIDEHMPVIVIAPHDRIFEKTVSNMQEVAARGGKIILITDRQGRGPRDREDDGDDRAARRAGVHRADDLCAADPDARLLHGGVHGHRRRPAAQSREVGDGGIGLSGIIRCSKACAASLMLRRNEAAVTMSDTPKVLSGMTRLRNYFLTGFIVARRWRSRPISPGRSSAGSIPG